MGHSRLVKGLLDFFTLHKGDADAAAAADDDNNNNNNNNNIAAHIFT